MNGLDVAGCPVGDGHPCFIIAEAGVNHNGNLEQAFRLIDAAIDAGADAVKFQTFRADALVTRTARKARYQAAAEKPEESQYDMLKRLELPPQAFARLYGYCGQRGIRFLSTPFDASSAACLYEIGVSAFKIGSGDVTNRPLLQQVGRYGKPVILSTGMSTMDEVADAVQTLQASNVPSLVLMHCVSCYPAEPRDINLPAMHELRACFGVPVGFSDHTEGASVAIAAVARGACVLEKHLTLDCDQAGPDHHASLDPMAFRRMVQDIRRMEPALVARPKEPTVTEQDVRTVARRSIVTVRDLRPGSVLRLDDLAFRRPGTGLSPAMVDHVLNRPVRIPIAAGEMITLEMLA